MTAVAGIARVREQPSLGEVVEGAWRSFERAAVLQCRVSPAVPVLFFGNLDAYCNSSLRVVTVGLNPSLQEFPGSSRLRSGWRR